jgi:hypothetical protein
MRPEMNSLLGPDASWSEIEAMRGIEPAHILLPTGCETDDALACFWGIEHVEGSPAPRLLKAIERVRAESRAGAFTWAPARVEFSDVDRAAMTRYFAAPGLILFAATQIMARVRPQGGARRYDITRSQRAEAFAGWQPDYLDQPDIWER